MKEVDAAKLVASLATAFPDFWRFLSDEQQADTRKVYRTMLLDLPYAIGDAAVGRLLATCRKMPPIAEIRAMVATLANGREHTGLEAFGAARALVRKWGRRRVPGVDFQITDPVLARCVDAVGWGDLCDMEPNDPAVRSQFVRMYEELAAQQREDLSVGAIAAPIPARRLGDGPKSIAGILESHMPKQLKP